MVARRRARSGPAVPAAAAAPPAGRARWIGLEQAAELGFTAVRGLNRGRCAARPFDGATCANPAQVRDPETGESLCLDHAQVRMNVRAMMDAHRPAHRATPGAMPAVVAALPSGPLDKSADPPTVELPALPQDGPMDAPAPAVTPPPVVPDAQMPPAARALAADPAPAGSPLPTSPSAPVARAAQSPGPAQVKFAGVVVSATAWQLVDIDGQQVASGVVDADGVPVGLESAVAGFTRA